MIGTQEMILIFVAVILLFGASKLPELARAMGKSMGEFKKAQHEAEREMHAFVEEEKKKTKSEGSVEIYPVKEK